MTHSVITYTITALVMIIAILANFSSALSSFCTPIMCCGLIHDGFDGFTRSRFSILAQVNIYCRIFFYTGAIWLPCSKFSFFPILCLGFSLFYCFIFFCQHGRRLDFIQAKYPSRFSSHIFFLHSAVRFVCSLLVFYSCWSL